MPERPRSCLGKFGKSLVILVKLLEQNPSLGLIEQIFTENHIHILHMAYYSWKLRQDQPFNPTLE